MTDIHGELASLYASQELPSHDDLLFLTDQAISLLEEEASSYRPEEKTADGKKAGGLLDFTQAPLLPLIVVPDLHARADFFLHLMEYPLEKLGIGHTGGEGDESGRQANLTVLDGLALGRLRLVCVGDLFHSEKRGQLRWLAAWDEYQKGNYESKEMTAEMLENLILFQMVLRVKNEYPRHFHFLKGNHENILNESGRGNYPFRKFADEGNMVYDFMLSHYGDALLHLMSLWEHALPVCAAFPSCVVSHAEPKHFFSRKEIIAMRKNPDLVLGLTWTANDEADEGSVEKTLCGLLGREGAKNAVWISGHRPVPEKYALRQGGRLVQIHNPFFEQIALLQPGKIFNPETDIILLR